MLIETPKIELNTALRIYRLTVCQGWHYRYAEVCSKGSQSHTV